MNQIEADITAKAGWMNVFESTETECKTVRKKYEEKFSVLQTQIADAHKEKEKRRRVLSKVSSLPAFSVTTLPPPPSSRCPLPTEPSQPQTVVVSPEKD